MMRRLGWAQAVLLLAPVFYSAWVSFSPDSFLTPPTDRWSLRWYEAFLDDRRWMAALARTLVVGVLAAAVAVVLGGLLALAVVRHRFRGRSGLTFAAVLPSCLPPVVLGMGLLPLLQACGLWGGLTGLVLIHGLLGLPVTFLLIRSQLAQLDPALEAAARGLGASPGQVFRRITLPLVRPSLLAGGAAAFVISFNEALVTLFLAAPASETLPAVIWPQLRYAASPLVAVASCVSATVTIGAVLLLVRFLRKAV